MGKKGIDETNLRIQNPYPQDRGGNHRHDGRKKEYGSIQADAPDIGIQKQRKGNAGENRERYGKDGIKKGIVKRLPEKGIVEKQLPVIGQADEAGAGYNIIPAETQV
jgi:hypothetical protein